MTQNQNGANSIDSNNLSSIGVSSGNSEGLSVVSGAEREQSSDNKTENVVLAILSSIFPGAGAWLQDNFNKDAEKRQEEMQIRAEGRANAEYDRRLADMRNYENPSAIARRYAQAGINPLSVMTNGGPITSSTSSPSMSNPTSFPSKAIAGPGLLSLISQRAELKKVLSSIENEKIVAQSTANRNNAEADAIRGGEQRASSLFPHQITEIIRKNYGLELSNEYQEVVNYIAENTKDNKVLQDRYTTQQLFQNLRIARQTYNNAVKDGLLKDEELNIMRNQVDLLAGQIFAQEVANALGVFKYEQFTGIDYYTGEKVGDGLAQFEYDSASYKADLVKFEKLLAEKDLQYYDVNTILDNVLKVVDIADIVNDDVFQWMSEKERNEMRTQLEELRSRERSRDNRNSNNTRIFLTLLPYLLKKLL